jgi:hypothetical protein
MSELLKFLIASPSDAPAESYLTPGKVGAHDHAASSA